MEIMGRGITQSAKTHSADKASKLVSYGAHNLLERIKHCYISHFVHCKTTNTTKTCRLFVIILHQFFLQTATIEFKFISHTEVRSVW